jgi:hypothetical protein
VKHPPTWDQARRGSSSTEHYGTKLHSMQADSVRLLQSKRDVVGVRKRSSRGKGFYSEDVHRYGRRNQVLSRARQVVRGQKQGARSKDDL